ncbi:hypothetical protein ABE10_01450 [Bacillus toyonensis]|nr:hypothetical protein [Bacillus toyonensis]
MGVRRVRAGLRGAGGERHPVPPEERGPRHGQSPGLLPRPAGRLVATGGAMGARPVAFARQRHPGRSGAPCRRAAEGAPASGHPLRRDGAHPAPRGRGRPGGARQEGEADRHPMGQGRRGLDGTGEVRPAGAGHAGGFETLLRPDRRRHRGALDARHHPQA